MLCLIALRNTEARRYLQSQEWLEVMNETPGSEMLARILGHELRPDDPASLNRFMSTLSAEQESLVASWLLQKMPPDPAAVARDWWRGLQRPVLRRRLESAQSRMKLPGLSAGELVALQKQVVDLRGQLDDFSRFSPSRSEP
jgi:hypothetical protein